MQNMVKLVIRSAVSIPLFFIKNLTWCVVAVLLKSETSLYWYNVFYAWFIRNRELIAFFGFLFFCYVWCYRIERLVTFIFFDKVFAQVFVNIKNFVSSLVDNSSVREGAPMTGINNISPSFDDNIVYEPNGGGFLSFFFDDTVFCFSVLYWFVVFVVVAYNAYFKGGSGGAGSSGAENNLQGKSGFDGGSGSANPMLTNSNTNPMLTNSNTNPMLTNSNTNPMLTNSNTNPMLTNNNNLMLNYDRGLPYSKGNPMLPDNDNPNRPSCNNNDELLDPYSDMPALYDPDYEHQIDTSRNIIRESVVVYNNVISRVYPTGSDPYNFRVRSSNVPVSDERTLTRMAYLGNGDNSEPVYTYVIPWGERLEKLEAARAYYSFRDSIPAIEPNEVSHFYHKLRECHDELYLHDLRILKFLDKDFTWPSFMDRVGTKVFFNTADGYEIIVPTGAKLMVKCSDGVERPIVVDRLLDSIKPGNGPFVVDNVYPGYDEVMLRGTYSRVLANIGSGNYYIGAPIFDQYQWQFRNPRGGGQESRIYVRSEYTDARLDPLRSEYDPFFTQARDKADDFFLSLDRRTDKSSESGGVFSFEEKHTSTSGGMKEDADNLFFEVLEKITNF